MLTNIQYSTSQVCLGCERLTEVWGACFITSVRSKARLGWCGAAVNHHLSLLSICDDVCADRRKFTYLWFCPHSGPLVQEEMLTV